MKRRPNIDLLALTVLSGCLSRAPSEEAVARAPADLEESRSGAEKRMQAVIAADGAEEGGLPDEARGSVLGGLGVSGFGAGGGGAAPRAPVAARIAKPEASLVEPEPAPGRSWFPETFLFEPLIPTDASGRAELTVKVPDRLTTWRILALAHTREGTQAGAVARFLGTLPVYVDAVVPPFLYAGDELRLPLQVVNTTEAPISATLGLEVDGARLGGGAGPLVAPARGSTLRTATLLAERAGTVRLRARFGEEDAVERSFEVRPTGRLRTVTRSGVLAAARTISEVLPAGADPAQASVRLEVFPGALALLREELLLAGARGGVAEDAYALRLAGRGPGLLQKLGGEVDAARLREETVRISQRALQAGRAPDAQTAALLAGAVLAHPDNAVLARLGARLVGQLASAQRPDGTFAGETGWTLQRLLVATAEGVSAIRADESEEGKRRSRRATLLAGGAYERSVARVEDPYTAARMLASGAVEGGLAGRLRARVREAVSASADGRRELQVPAGVVRADGLAPSAVEASAAAVLALLDDPEAKDLLPELGATVLAAYRPVIGWGDGRTNLLALEAVLALFSAPLPDKVEVTLSRGSAELARGTLEGARLKEVLRLSAPLGQLASGAAETFTVRAEPPLAGLAFALTLESYGPWGDEGRAAELSIERPSRVRAGQAVPITLRTLAPTGVPLTIAQGLPAGVTPERASLEALQNEGALERFEIRDGELILELPAREPGGPVVLAYRVVPSFAGRLGSGPTRIFPRGAPGEARFLPPTRWVVD
jgi:hypothetical protein